jgi:predicted metalloenzyme YecM
MNPFAIFHPNPCAGSESKGENEPSVKRPRQDTTDAPQGQNGVCAENNPHVKIQELTARFDAMQQEHGHQIASLQADLQRYGVEHSRLKDDHDALNVMHVNMKASHAELTGKHEQLTMKHKTLNDDHNTLKRETGLELSRMKADHYALNVIHEDMKASHDELAEKHEQLVVKNDTLQTSHTELAGKHEQLVAEHNTLNNDYNKLEREIEDTHRMRLLQLSMTGVHLSTWNTAFPPVGWRGVSWSGQFITRIALHGIQGTGCPDLTCLPSTLETLDLHINHFSGSLNLTQLPLMLTTLNLNSNRFSGPVELTRLPPVLVTLSLHNNQLSGEVDLASLPATLSTLHLFNNNFTAVRIPAHAQRSEFPADLRLKTNPWNQHLPTEPTWIAALMRD